MSDPRKGIPSLDAQSVQACSEKVEEILKCYNCELVFIQQSINGFPGHGRFQVIKATKKPENPSVIVSDNDTAN